MSERANIIQYLTKIAEYQTWSGGDSSVDGWLWPAYQAQSLRVDKLIYVIDQIAWPNFVEIENMVLREDALPSDRLKYIRSFGHLNKDQIELIVNHVHIVELFRNDPNLRTYSAVVFDYLANRIAEMWKARLNSLFPDREFDVAVDGLGFDPQVYAKTISSG